MLFYPVTPPDVTSSVREDPALSLLGQCGHGRGPGGRPGLAGRAGPGQGRPVGAGGGRCGEDPQRGCGGVPQAGGGRVGGGPPGRAGAGRRASRRSTPGWAWPRTGWTRWPGRRTSSARSPRVSRLTGKVKGAARRAMTPALAIRFTVLMTLMPSDADYAEVLAALMGDLAAVPWQRPYTLPTATVACTWREALGPAPLEQLRDRVLRTSTPGTRPATGGRSRWGTWMPARSTGR